MIRKSLLEEHTRKMQKAVRLITEQEIEEELQKVRVLKAAKKAWEEFQATGNIPDLIAKKPPEALWSEPQIKKEAITLFLLDHILVGGINTYPQFFLFTINAEATQSEKLGELLHGTLPPMRLAAVASERIDKVLNRLKERLNDVLNDDPSPERTGDKLLKSLGRILNTNLDSPRAMIRALEPLTNNAEWRREISHQALAAIQRMMSIGEHLMSQTEKTRSPAK